MDHYIERVKEFFGLSQQGNISKLGNVIALTSVLYSNGENFLPLNSTYIISTDKHT